MEGDFRGLGVGGGGKTSRDLRIVIKKNRVAEAEGMVVGILEATAPGRIGATEKWFSWLGFFALGRDQKLLLHATSGTVGLSRQTPLSRRPRHILTFIYKL